MICYDGREKEIEERKQVEKEKRWERGEEKGK